MVYFITAIDTGAGKSVATGAAALYLKSKGMSVITQKMVQTGCMGASEDIAVHRTIMSSGILPEDMNGLTCPYIFPFPASPKLSASLAGVEIELEKITSATEKLAEKYDVVLVEGVGGIMVPLCGSLTVVDYMQMAGYPAIIVSNGRLGSVNHSLLTLEACKIRSINIAGMIYNDHIQTNPVITEDTENTLREALHRYWPEAGFAKLPHLDKGTPLPDFSSIFGF